MVVMTYLLWTSQRLSQMPTVALVMVGIRANLVNALPQFRCRIVIQSWANLSLEAWIITGLSTNTLFDCVNDSYCIIVYMKT